MPTKQTLERAARAFQERGQEQVAREGLPTETRIGVSQCAVDLVKAAKHPFALHAQGDTFREFGIWDGDVIICDEDHDRTPVDGELVLADTGTQATIVRYRSDADMWVIGYYVTFEPRAPRA